MKSSYILSLLLFLLLFTNVSGAIKTQLSGRITDRKTGEPLAGVTVYIPDLKTGTVTDTTGRYNLDNLPKSKLLVQFSMVGYRTVIVMVDLSRETIRDVTMEYVATELNDVVITGLSMAADQKRTPTPISIVAKTELLQNSSVNIIDAISTQPGISQITTGTGISKPVIRGLGYNRVVVVIDGIRQEGQQWGDEHGIETDEYAVNKVEILKGPASLAYGSDAIAGVINMLSAPSLPEGKIQGNAVANYQTNNGLFGYSANIAGNQKGLVWDMRYSNKLAHAYQNKYDGYVYNSGFKENAVKGLIGINRSWGYSYLELTAYNFTPGIIEGERDSLTGKFTKFSFTNSSESVDIASNADLKSYSISVPFQKVHHYKAISNSNFAIGKGSLKTTFGFQQNQRQEYGESEDTYGLYFLLNTLNYDVNYTLPEFKNFNISLGTNGMRQSSYNKGTEFLVPEYDLFDFGAFVVMKKALGKFDISGGLRYDIRNQEGKELYLNSLGEKVEKPSANDVQKFAAFHSTFSGISGSLGAAWQVTKTVYSKLNLSRGYRAPNIGELGSNGIHEGTLRYEIGDSKLEPENSLQVDYTVGLNTEHISAEASAFYNTINNFIFLRKLTSSAGVDSIVQGNSVFKFVSGDAHLYGGEIRFDIHPHPYDWIHFENSFSFVRATQQNQPDSAKYLPFTPPPRLLTTIQTDIKKFNAWLDHLYVKLSVDNYFAQNHFYAAYGTETGTHGYTLLDVGVGAGFVRKNKTICSVYISANNLADVAYQSHLSRLKYTPVNYTTGRVGVFNMGRNVSFKILIPIAFKQ